MEGNVEINAYNVSSTTNTPSVTVKKEGSSLGMDDFLNLLVSQMTNQDSMNPMENTEFVSQLAQFSSLQAMTDLAEISKQSQATSLIGKTVVMASYNNKGELVIKEGTVERVTIYNGETKLYVDGIAYDFSNVMEIKTEETTNNVEETLGKILDEITNNNSSETETENLATD